MSLHENEKRAQMHPADQYEAYARLRAKGMTAAEIAARAGVSERQVTKLMRLGTVAPELLAAYRNDDLDLQTLMAFTVTDDRQAQLDVWAKARGGGGAWPEHIRQQLTEGAVIGSSGLASFVGLEAYEKAGGRVQHDLFSRFDDEAVYLLDRSLLVRLAEAELKKTADRLAKRWKWVEIQLDPDWDRIHTLHRLRGVPGAATEAERKRLDKLADEMQDIADNPPMDPAEQGKAYARSQELNAKYEKLEARIAARIKYRPEDMRIAGCIVTLKGPRADVITGLVLPEDVPAKPKKTARKKAADTPADAPADTPDADGAKTADGGDAAPDADGAAVHAADFYRWIETDRRRRRRWSGLALAAAAPAALLLGLLVQQQFQIVPAHDPSGGWSGWIWESHGRAIVDCAVEARQTKAEVDCPLVVRRP
jgi:ParB family chromosome partitioning protein